MFLSRPDEKLTSHIQEVVNQFNRIVNYRNINDNLKNMIMIITEKEFLEPYRNTIYELLISSIKYHDEGKKNPYFQKYIHNKLFENYNYPSEDYTYHSYISSIAYVNDMYEKHIKTIIVPNKKKQAIIKCYLSNIILSLAYNISKHHSSLNDIISFNIFISDMIQYYNKFADRFIHLNIDIDNLKSIEKYNYKNIVQDNLYAFHMFCKLGYSLLVTSDFLAVYKFKNGKDLEFNNIDGVLKEKFINNFNNNEITKSINNYPSNKLKLTELNKYRTELYLEAEKNLIDSDNRNIFFLEAPTGGGKSMISLNLALNLLNDVNNKIFYVSPLNNVAGQTYDVIESILDATKKEVVLVNSSEEIVTEEKYEQDYLDYQTLNYPITLISHVKLFNIIFGCSRKDNLSMSSLCNSIIIIDEIQNYNNKLWIKLINTLKEYANLLNLKIIIMSATLPKMDMLIENKEDFKSVELIKNRHYYYDFFKKRVKYDYSLLEDDKCKNLDNIISKIEDSIKYKEKGRILIETLTTNNCENIYNALIKYKNDGFQVFKMLAITNKETRKYIIDTIQKKDANGNYINQKIILVGTQCIEAGIDIDMNIGFKDISLLDFDEQFIGRIERNFKEVGICYFFDLDDDNFIYKEDYRTEHNLKSSEEWRYIFENKTFDTYYYNNYKWLLQEETKEYIKYKSNLEKLQYKSIYDSVQLINSTNYTFIFLTNFEINGEIYEANKILEKYKQIKKNKGDMEYAEKQIKLKQIKNELDKFTYNINTYKFKQDIVLEQEEGYYIVENGGNYFDNLNDKGDMTIKSNLNLSLFTSSINLFI